MTLEDKIKDIVSKGYICDHCLGRQFAQLLTGTDNENRGKVLRNFLAMKLDADEINDIEDSNFQDFEFRNYDVEEENGECFVCQGLFEDLDEWGERILDKLEDYEFDNFLVGTRLPDELVKNEEELWEETGIEFCEEMKADVNREIGKIIEEETDKTVEFELPQLVVLLNMQEDEVELDVNSICIYAEYQKNTRGIPQTEWPSGKYEISIEELIAPAFLRAADAIEEKFHGAGREDIDAKCLGWRPFIIEVLEPKRRSLDLDEIKRQVNRSNEVQIRDLKEVGRDKVEVLKEWQPDKTYRAKTEFEDGVPEDLERLEELECTIEQRTPSRVEHRRSDRVRRREVKNVDWERIDENTIELEVKAEAGTYIKELISGDGKRTKPSVTSIFDNQAECEELDVIKIHDRDSLDL